MAEYVRLVRGGLSGRVFAVTKWKATPERGDEAWEALEKHDVTDDFDSLMAQALAEARARG